MEQLIDLEPGDRTGVNGACRTRLLFVMENIDCRPQNLDEFMAECRANRSLAGKRVMKKGSRIDPSLQNHAVNLHAHISNDIAVILVLRYGLIGDMGV